MSENSETSDDRALLPFDDGGEYGVSRDSISSPQVSGIYQIRNLHSGRVYIGKSRNIHSRWLSHRSALDRGIHINDDLQGDWEIYGVNAFEFTVLEEITGHNALCDAEARHLAIVRNPYNVQSVPLKPIRATNIVDKEPLTPSRFVEIFYGDMEASGVAHILFALSGITGSPEDISLGKVLSNALTQNPEVVEDFAIFQDQGYMGLYAGEKARDIAERKGLARGEHVLDWMGSEELAANWFRITQAEAKLKRDGVDTKTEANATHYHVGQTVRRAIAELGGTMPEDLPTPAQSSKQVERAEQARLNHASQARRQPSLFGAGEGERDGGDDA